jgi:hypothetical protein
MKVTVESRWGTHTILLKQGVQSFRLDYQGTRAECLWYARQFRKALKNHDMFVIAKHDMKGDGE